jgi:phosphate transport system protein
MKSKNGIGLLIPIIERLEFKQTGEIMEHEHISTSFDIQLDELRQSLLNMGDKVGLMIANSILSLVNRDTPLAELTIALDREVNAAEALIDERCMELLALRQPAARDLRFITTVLKIVTDLERIGDKCANIAKRARDLNEEPLLKPYIDTPRMGQWAEVMVKESLDAFLHGDLDLAIKVCKDKTFMHDLNEKIQRLLLTYMMEDPTTITRAMKINYISKALDRISDHATYIAEMAIFMIKGKDIRHTKVQ